MVWIAPVATLILTALAATLAVGLSIRLLQARAILDNPVGRSSHVTPTPTGAGLALVPVILLAWALIQWNPGFWHNGPEHRGLEHWRLIRLLIAAAGLAAISWFDDLRGLSPLTRLAAQILAVIVVLSDAPGGRLYFDNLLPFGLDLIAAGFFLVWFVNLFNFMDGIDGMAGSETGFIGLGVVLVGSWAGLDMSLILFGAALGGAGFGFLIWNWQPAKIFLGDVGSIPIGFLVGWLLLELSAQGLWAPALILPLYYLMDATLTLFRRIFRGQRPWEAHHDHFYQTATGRGWSHARVVRLVCLANCCLIGLALLAVTVSPWPALAGTFLVVIVLLAVLARP